MTVAAANRRFARKRRDWLNVLNTSCELLVFEPQDDCPNSFQLPLIEQNFVESHNNDSLLVKRILGDLYMAVVGFADLTAVASQANIMRLALKRWETPGGAQNPPIFNPMLGDDIQLDPGGDDQGDFSEMRAIHEWAHLFESDESLTETQVQNAVVFPHYFDIAGTTEVDLSVLPFASGTGDGVSVAGVPGAPWTLGGTVDCDPCEGGIVQPGFIMKAPGTWRLHIDLKFRKGIRLHENQALTLFGGWENLALPGGQRQAQQNVVVLGGLRALIET